MKNIGKRSREICHINMFSFRTKKAKRIICFLVMCIVYHTGLFADEKQEAARMVLTYAEVIAGELILKSISAWQNNIGYHRELQEGGAVIESISDLTTGICKTTLYVDHANVYRAEFFIEATLEAYNHVLTGAGFKREQGGSNSTWIKWTNGGIIVFSINLSVDKKVFRTSQEFISIFTVH